MRSLRTCAAEIRQSLIDRRHTPLDFARGEAAFSRHLVQALTESGYGLGKLPRRLLTHAILRRSRRSMTSLQASKLSDQIDEAIIDGFELRVGMLGGGIAVVELDIANAIFDGLLDDDRVEPLSNRHARTPRRDARRFLNARTHALHIPRAAKSHRLTRIRTSAAEREAARPTLVMDPRHRHNPLPAKPTFSGSR